MRKNQSGFTLVELVVVILVLGILSASALPRFMNVGSQAHSAAVSGVGGSFGTAVVIAKAQWIANGTAGADDAVANFGENNVSVNVSGWPININDSASVNCTLVWNNILQNPPTASTGATFDYQVAASGTDACTYTYQADASKAILYNSINGAVTVSQ